MRAAFPSKWETIIAIIIQGSELYFLFFLILSLSLDDFTIRTFCTPDAILSSSSLLLSVQQLYPGYIWKIKGRIRQWCARIHTHKRTVQYRHFIKMSNDGTYQESTTRPERNKNGWNLNLNFVQHSVNSYSQINGNWCVRVCPLCVSLTVSSFSLSFLICFNSSYMPNHFNCRRILTTEEEKTRTHQQQRQQLICSLLSLQFMNSIQTFVVCVFHSVFFPFLSPVVVVVALPHTLCSCIVF